MPSPKVHLEHVRAAGERIAADAQGRTTTDVGSCPGMTVADLLHHTAAFSRWVATIVRTGSPPADDLERSDDTLAAHREEHRALVEALAAADPDDPAWTWSVGADTKRFWFRRAAQELAVHGWDAANAAGRDDRVDPVLAADGVDEMLSVFGAPNVAGYETVAKVLDQGDRTIRLEATDTDRVWTFKQSGDVFDLGAAEPEVTARASASDLLLFLWGRKPVETLDVSGPRDLLDRWQERVRI